MSTGVTVLIIAIVVIAIIVVVALVSRSKKKQQKPHMGLPELGALSGDGLDKQHASAPRTQATTSPTPSNPSTTDSAQPERRA